MLAGSPTRSLEKYRGFTGHLRPCRVGCSWTEVSPSILRLAVSCRFGSRRTAVAAVVVYERRTRTGRCCVLHLADRRLVHAGEGKIRLFEGRATPVTAGSRRKTAKILVYTSRGVLGVSTRSGAT